MKKYCVLASAVLATMALAASSFAWGINQSSYGDNTTLQIARTVSAASANECEWTFYLHYGSLKTNPKPISMFSVGLLTDDTNGADIGSLTDGHFYGYDSSFAKTVKTEYADRAVWAGFSLPNNNDAWFSFKTDLMGIDYAAHFATNSTYVAIWEEQETPGGAVPGSVPEPASFVALFCGCVGLFARRKW